MEINGFSISVILPVYNVEPYIKQCVESILGQTYTNFECLIVDDCGTDKSIDIAKSVISQYNGDIEFKFLKNNVNSGISVSRNLAIKESRGDFLFFIDSDDKIYTNTLNELISKVRIYPEVDLVQGNCDLEDPYDYRAKLLNYKENYFPEYLCDESIIHKTILHWSFPTTVWNKLIKRSLVVDNALYFMEGIIHEDEHWKWLIHKHIKKMAFTNVCTYWYRTVNPASIMRNPDLTKSFVSKIKIFESIALHGSSQNDVCFGIHFLPYECKISSWNMIEDKKLVNDQLKKTLLLLKSKDVDVRYIRHLYFLCLPIWIMKNRFFAKFYYEYEKRNNLTYSFS